MKVIQYSFLSIVFLVFAVTQAQASSVTLPNTFSADTPARAAEVNDNFTAVKTAVDDNDSRVTLLEASLATLQNTVIALQASVATQASAITALQATVATQTSDISTLQNTVTAQDSAITALQATVATQTTDISALQATVATQTSQLSAVNNSNVMALEPYLSVDTVSDPLKPLVQFHGANVQLVNGLASTATANGLGNLIIGYDEADATAVAHCTLGTNPGTGAIVTDSITCAAAGGTWTTTGFKTGSHYLVMGSQNNYSRWGGMVAGVSNTSNYDFASVSGGLGNTASGTYSSVSGGFSNNAIGSYSSVSGGYNNIASGDYSSVSGGGANIAIGAGSSVSGGYVNIAIGAYSSVLGGNTLTASTVFLTIPALP